MLMRAEIIFFAPCEFFSVQIELVARQNNLGSLKDVTLEDSDLFKKKNTLFKFFLKFWITLTGYQNES